MAFTKIKNEAKQDEAGKTGRVFMPRKRIAIVATVLTLVIGTGTLAGVQYAKWSDGVNISVHGTDKQKEKLEKQGYTSYDLINFPFHTPTAQLYIPSFHLLLPY